MTQKPPISMDDLLPATPRQPIFQTRLSRFTLSAMLLTAAVAAWLVFGGAHNPLAAPAGPPACLLAAGLVAIACLAVILVLDHRLARSRLTEARAIVNYRLFAQALEALPIGLQIKDADLRYVWVNAEHGRRSGYRRGAMLGRTVADVVPDPAFARMVTEHDRRVLTTGVIDGPHEQVIPGLDGGIAHITLTTKVPLVDAGVVTHVLSTSADLTAMRDDQRRAEEARRLLETVLEVAPVAILVSDRDGNVRWANHALRQLFGWPAEQPVGAALDSIADLAPITVAARRLLCGHERLVRFEYITPAAGGTSPRQMLVTMAPVLGASGQVQQILTIATDVTGLKQARSEADIANRLIEGILRHVPLTIQVKDTNHRFQWVNRAFADAVERREADLLGKTVDDIGIPSHDAQRSLAFDDLVLATSETMRFEQKWASGGRPQEMMVIKAPILNAAGTATHVITIGANVTELNRLRAEAGDARHRLQAVLDALPIAIALKDRDRRFQWLNRTFRERVPGGTNADIIGQRLEDFSTDPAFVEAAMRQDEVVLATGADVDPLPQRHPSPTGEVKEYLIHRQAFRAADGAIDGIVIFGFDVTDLLRVTNELRDVNATLERRVAERAAELAKVNTLVSTVIENAAVPIILYGQGGQIVRWNPAAERVFGYSEPEILASEAPLRTSEMTAQFEQLRRDVVAGRTNVGREITRRHKDGRDVPFLASVAPLWDANGEVEGAVAILQDLTELRATEHQLRHALKMEALGHLTGGVAHDFNNLLAVIMGNLDLLLQDLPPDAFERELATQAIEAAERGANLVHRLLAFARQQALRPVPIDIDRLITAMRSLLQRAVGEAVAINHIAPGKSWLALVDPSQLENAVLNLAVNARDAMASGGTLTIATRLAIIDAAEAATLGDLIAGEYVCLTVSDTGCGIPPNLQAQVFEPFFTTKDVGKGSGLGLSMVFGFVKQSGGHVRLDSQPDRGTAISLYLPRVEGSVRDQPPRSDVAAGSGETILLVEDNDQLRRTSVILLTALGYHVIATEDAASALQQFRQHPEIALLFTDVVLPGGASGFDVARQIRKLRPAMPVLFTSGFADPSMARASGFEGDVVILAKPFRRAELAQKLRVLLTRPT